MRILHLTSRMGIGGAETHISTLAHGQIKLGHKVFCASAGGVGTEELVSSGAIHFSLPLDRRTPTAVRESVAGILDIIKENKIDVIHAHSRIPSFIIRLIYGKVKALGCTFVTTAHMPFSASPAERALTEWGEGTVAVSCDIEEYLKESYALCAERITVIENGIDTGKFRPLADAEKKKLKESLGISADSRVICSASRTSASRAGCALWLCAHAPDILEGEETLLLLLSGAVGRERDLLGEIRERAKEANEALGREAVRLIVGLSDLSHILPAADIFVGVSRAALEAMSAGVATIIAGNEGYGGIISEENAPAQRESNFTGRGCTGSFENIKKELATLRASDLRSIGNECREYVCRELSAEGMSRAVCAFYEETKKKASRPHLLFVGHYGAGNYGDDEACRVLCRRFGDKYNLHFVCRDKRQFAKISDADAIHRADIARITKEIKRADCVVFGTGNILQDDTSLRSLLYYREIFALSKKYKKKTALLSNGIGPLHTDVAKEAVREILKTCAYLSLREDESCRLALSLEESANARLAADLVYLNGAKTHKKGLQPQVARGLFSYIGGRKYAVLCPRADMAESDAKAATEYLRALSDAGVITVIVPLCPALDLKICQFLHRAIPRSCIYTGVLDYKRLCLIMRGAELALGGRLHAGITSICAECAFVGWDSDSRIRANLAHAQVGGYLSSEHFTADDIERAVREQKALVEEGKYKVARARLARLAEDDLSHFEDFLEE